MQLQPGRHPTVEPLTEGPLGVGSTFVVSDGSVILGVSKILVYDRPQRAAYEERVSGMTSTHRLELRAHDDGTFLDYRVELRPVRWFTPIAVVAWLRTRSRIAQYLDLVKAYCERPA
jgi:hypothetical protein